MVIARRSSCCLTSLIRRNAVSLQQHRFFSQALLYVPVWVVFFCFFFSTLLVVCRSALKVVSSRLSDVAHERCRTALRHADQLWIIQMGSFGTAPVTHLFWKGARSFPSASLLSFLLVLQYLHREKLMFVFIKIFAGGEKSIFGMKDIPHVKARKA